MGCYIDKPARDLGDFLGNVTTKAACKKMAIAKDKKYYGLQYGGQCFAGDTVGAYGKAAASACNMHCSSGQVCGGTWRQNVYEVTGNNGYFYSEPMDEYDEDDLDLYNEQAGDIGVNMTDPAGNDGHF